MSSISGISPIDLDPFSSECRVISYRLLSIFESGSWIWESEDKLCEVSWFLLTTAYCPYSSLPLSLLILTKLIDAFSVLVAGWPCVDSYPSVCFLNCSKGNLYMGLLGGVMSKFLPHISDRPLLRWSLKELGGIIDDVETSVSTIPIGHTSSINVTSGCI